MSVASIAGVKGQAYTSAYCASKGGVVLLTKLLALELAARRRAGDLVARAVSRRP